jgi:hypothetical protein
MGGMSLAGRRGEVLWSGGTFLTGKGRQLTYDAFVVRFGLVVPLALGELVHAWDFPMTKFGGPAKGIPLRPDPAFKRRVLTANWAGLAAVALLIAAPVLAANDHPAPAAVAAVAGVAAGVWAYRSSGAPRRDRDIRLVLGLHDWGGSDPATWHPDLCREVVDPGEAFGAESFAALGRGALADGRWGEAMWAARLSVAVEGGADGEALTDAVLADPAAADALHRVRRRPGNRDEVFGPAPPLGRWVGGRPERHVLAIG